MSISSDLPRKRQRLYRKSTVHTFHRLYMGRALLSVKKVHSERIIWKSVKIGPHSSIDLFSTFQYYSDNWGF